MSFTEFTIRQTVWWLRQMQSLFNLIAKQASIFGKIFVTVTIPILSFVGHIGKNEFKSLQKPW